jgi:hypothetical protein
MLKLLASNAFIKLPPNPEGGEIFYRVSEKVELGRNNISSVPLHYQRSGLGYNKVLPRLY